MDHLKGIGCGKCFNVYKRGKARQKKSREQFIEKARMVHGNKYDYSKVVYENAKKRVCIVCPEHGDFWISPNKHLSGRGCQKCSIEKRNKNLSLGKEQFIETFSLHSAPPGLRVLKQRLSGVLSGRHFRSDESNNTFPLVPRGRDNC